jgi:hypothetical protein
LSLSEKALKLKTEELNELNMALTRANQQLELKTSEQNASNKGII